MALFVCVTAMPVHSQIIDSLEVVIGTTVIIAGKNHQPLWLVANRFGTITDRQADVSTHIQLRNIHVLTPISTPDSAAGRTLKGNGLRIDYKLDLYHNNHFRNVFIQEGYVKLAFKNWQFLAGRFEEKIGEVDAELSSGSLGVSGNALPIPKAGIAVADYTGFRLPKDGYNSKPGTPTDGLVGSNTLKMPSCTKNHFTFEWGKKSCTFMAD